MRLSHLALCCLLLCVGFVRAATPQQPPSPLQQAATKVLREMPVKLYEGRATEADVQACLKLIELAPNDNAKRPFFLLTAQYRRLALQRPEQTLAMLAPHLLGREKARAWQKSNDDAVKAARAQWAQDDAVAKKAKQESPKQPSAYLVDLPPLAEWTINESTALFAVEAAHCLAALDRPQQAIEIIDTIGQKYEDETRVLAAECGADLFIQMRMYERAIEFYGFALNVLETLKQKEYDPGKGERVFFSEEQVILRNRLQSKYGIAQRLFDEDRFGPDWVAYRDAQRLHFAGRYLEAYFSYMEVVDQYRDSVYGEAATCYLIEILCKMSDRENIKDAAETFKTKQKELETAKLLVQYGEVAREPETMMQTRRDSARQLEKMILLWKSMPLGNNAILAAEKYTEQFIERDKYGLYRGEVMLTVGLCWLETFIDREKGEPWIIRAHEWFDEVKQLDNALLKLEVPDRSKAVSTPPPTERVTDEWTNIVFSRLNPGDLFNRRECKWYLDSKIKDAVLWMGFFAFADDDLETAKTYWEKIAEIDAEYNRTIMETRGTGTTSSRLLYFLETRPGTLHATMEELKAFKDKNRRFAVLLADCAYVAENRSMAKTIYQKLENDSLGKLSRNEKAYVTYAIFSCMCWNPNEDEIAYIGTKLRVFEGTPTEKRALVGYANRIDRGSVNVGNMKKRLQVREQLKRKFPKSFEAEEATFLNTLEMTILVYQFLSVERFLREKGPDQLLESAYRQHKSAQKQILPIIDRTLRECDEYDKKYANGRFTERVREHRDFLKEQKTLLEGKQFYILL